MTGKPIRVLALVLQVILLIPKVKNLNLYPLWQPATRKLVQDGTRAPNEDARIPRITQMPPLKDHLEIFIDFLGTQTSVGLARAMHRAIGLELKRFRITVHLRKILFSQSYPTGAGHSIKKSLGRSIWRPLQRKESTKRNERQRENFHSLKLVSQRAYGKRD